MTQYYCLREGGLCLPPRCGVTKTGSAVTNFAWRVQHDAAFATENGYYPMGEAQASEPPARAGYRTEIRWSLVSGCWQRSFTQSPMEGELLG